MLGGGAAGLMCAIEAARGGKRIAVVEHNSEAGRKILISGGGRCNFTNLHTGPGNFVSANPHFAKSALARYQPKDFLALVNRHRIAFHEKTAGQLFCDGSAREIVAMLLRECEAGKVSVLTGRRVSEVRRTTEFVIDTDQGSLAASILVVATGGLSIPKIGATDFGYRLARQFGLRIAPCRPALTPLLWSAEDRDRFQGLAGVSAEVHLRAARQSFREKMLFTHTGVSGPAILQISTYWTPGGPLTVDLAPGRDLDAQLVERNDGLEVQAILSGWLPRRLVERWLETNGFASKPVRHMAMRDRKRLAATLHAWTLHPAGYEGYGKAEVTAGGVDTDELSSQTMESRRVPGLYFVGEVVDVTGQLGGFNFQWAWASGHAAGRGIAGGG